MLDWHGGPFDPIGFDKARARIGVGNMARRRRGSRRAPQNAVHRVIRTLALAPP